MAHFAEIDENNIVVNVLVVGNSDIEDENGVEQESLGIQFLRDLFGPEKNWIQTSWSASFRKNFAGIGYSYDQTRDAFIPPKPDLESWVLNETTCRWEAPVPIPSDAGTYAENGNYISYAWDEDNLSWIRSEIAPPQE